MMVVFGLDICSEIKATMKNKMAQLKKPHSSKSKQKMYIEDDSSSDDNEKYDMMLIFLSTITYFIYKK